VSWSVRTVALAMLMVEVNWIGEWVAMWVRWSEAKRVAGSFDGMAGQEDVLDAYYW
jgi:hypothetical protein